MEEFDRAVKKTRITIEGMADGLQRSRRITLLETITLAQRREQNWLKTPKGEPDEGDPADIVALNDDSIIRDYATDMRLVILTASLDHPSVLCFINDDFPAAVNPANTSEAEVLANKIREAPNLVGLWELTQQGSGYWILQLVCPDGRTKPIHGSLLVR